MNKPSSPTPTLSQTSNSSIEHLRIYQLVRSLEGRIYKLTKSWSLEQFYPLGDELRRSSSAAAHHIAEIHKYHSYSIKLESLHAARIAAENIIRQLEAYRTTRHGEVSRLIEDYVSLIRQSWGLIRYFRSRQQLIAARDQARAADEIVAARH